MSKTIRDLSKMLEDKGYYYSWQANIAMSFYDEYKRQRSKRKYLNNEDIHKIANSAAQNFLNSIMKY